MRKAQSWVEIRRAPLDPGLMTWPEMSEEWARVNKGRSGRACSGATVSFSAPCSLPGPRWAGSADVCSFFKDLMGNTCQWLPCRRAVDRKAHR